MESCVYEKGNGTRQHVVDVENIKLYEGIAFQRTKDHSKWAVSKDKKWIFIGDLNRMESQMKRGGNVVCMSNPNLWKAFNDSIDDYDELDKQPNAGCPEITLELSDHCVPK
ncbi:plancitoxin-1-like [Ptychodera flava]|uniref:plancitoxin-1-like n=1 Tax=Ptychodera flava TaxID=63121 RepID=UPI00396A0485